MATCSKCGTPISFWQSMCDSCFDTQIESNVDLKSEAEQRRAVYASVRESNEQKILQIQNSLTSSTAKLFGHYIGQEIALNLPDQAGFVSAQLHSVNNEFFTVLLGKDQVSHHPLTKIMQILENSDGSGVNFLGRFFPLVVILEQHTKVPTSFSTVGVGVSMPIG